MAEPASGARTTAAPLSPGEIGSVRATHTRSLMRTNRNPLDVTSRNHVVHPHLP